MILLPHAVASNLKRLCDVASELSDYKRGEGGISIMHTLESRALMYCNSERVATG